VKVVREFRKKDRRARNSAATPAALLERGVIERRRQKILRSRGLPAAEYRGMSE